MTNWDLRLDKAVEKMNKMSISELRQVARALGVSRPAVGKKERLVNDIVALAKGEISPVPLTNRGAPPKSDNFDRELYAEITELRQSCLNTAEPVILSVCDSGVKSETAGVYVGLLYESGGGYKLKWLSDGEICLREALVNKFLLRTGDKVKAECVVGADGTAEVTDVLSVNGELFGKLVNRPEFAMLSRVYAENRIKFNKNGACAALEMIDYFTPLAYGQRVLAFTENRRTSTELAKQLVKGLLGLEGAAVSAAFIGCTPEDRIYLSRSVKHDALFFAEFDEDKSEQMFTLTLAAEYAKRQAELGKNAVLIVDGFFRPAKSFNEVDRKAGAELKKILASAGAFEEGGSLTVIALSDISGSNSADDALKAEFTDFENAVLSFKTYNGNAVLNYNASFSDFVGGDAQELRSRPENEVFKIFLKD